MQKGARMNVATGIEPITALKSRSAELIKRAKEARQPVVITQNGKPSAVLQDVESYQKQQDTLLLLKFLARGIEDSRAGRTLSHRAVERRFSEKFKSLNNDE
jgi:prevent-host-death family protein